MSIKRMTKDDLKLSFGSFNPVGHTVLAFENDEVAARAASELKGKGFTEADILVYTAAELEPALQRLIDRAGGVSGFGYEITLMRRYLELAQEGAGWLVVYTPGDEAAERVREVAEALGAESAVRYHRLANEDLV